MRDDEERGNERGKCVGGGGDGRVKSNGCLTEKGEKETQELSLFCETGKTKQADYPRMPSGYAEFKQRHTKEL